MSWFGGKKQKKRKETGAMGEKVLEAMHDSVIILAYDGKIKLINPAARSLLGISDEEGLGLDHSSLLKLSNREEQVINAELNPINTSLKNNQYVETRKLNILKVHGTGSTPVMLNVNPIGEPSDDRVLVLRDISREIKEEAAKDDFISTASHEMRTPVASIEGYLGLALNPQTATIDTRARTYLDKAHESSQHLGRLFRDLLDTTKLDDGKLAINFVPVELNAIVRSIADAQAPNASRKGLSYHFNEGLSESLDNKSKKKLQPLLYVRVDFDLLHAAIGNLIENAIKYTKTGGISVEVKGDSGKAYISVSDSGIGIKDSELPHIFQKFYRIDNSDTRDIGGTGLGLYLVKQRIEAMQGNIWVESELGKGSKFTVVLPRLSEDEYIKQKIALDNAGMVPAKQTHAPVASVPVASAVPVAALNAPVIPPAQATAPPVPTNKNVTIGQAPTHSGVNDLSPERLAEIKRDFAGRLRENKENGKG